MTPPFGNLACLSSTEFSTVSTIKHTTEDKETSIKVFVNPDSLLDTLTKEGSSHVIVVCPTKRIAKAYLKTIKSAGITTGEIYSNSDTETINKNVILSQEGLIETVFTDTDAFANLDIDNIRYVVFITQNNQHTFKLFNL